MKLKSKTRTVAGFKVRADYVGNVLEVCTPGLDGELLGWSGAGQDVEAFLTAELHGMVAELVGERASDKLREQMSAAIAACCREVAAKVGVR